MYVRVFGYDSSLKITTYRMTWAGSWLVGYHQEKSVSLLVGRASGSRYMARLRATGADLGTGHKNNIRWMTVVTSD